MKLHYNTAPGAHRITAYGEGFVAVNEERIAGSVAVSPEHLVRDWAPEGPARDALPRLGEEHLRALTALEPAILLVGTGRSQRFLPPELAVWLSGQGIGLEVMDTGAACRTYNILAGEGRQVVAALLPITSEETPGSG